MWHNSKIDITMLPVVRKIKANCFKVKYNGDWAIAKFAQLDWEIRFIETETAIYRARLVDFENCRSGTEREKMMDVKQLEKQFEEDSGRGAPNTNNEEYKEGEYPIGI